MHVTATMVWRTPKGLLAQLAESTFVLIDATGAIVERYEPSDGLTLTRYYVAGEELREYIDILTIDLDEPDTLVFDGLVRDDDPDTLRFVETALGDAAVSDEAAKRSDA